MKEIEKDRKYWITKGLLISGSILAVITFFLPWYQVSGSYQVAIAPLYILYNGNTLYWFGLFNPSLIFAYYTWVVPIIIIDYVIYSLIITSLVLSIFRLSRKPSSMIMIIIVTSFVIISITILSTGIIPFSNTIPFFGISGSLLWGFSIGWFLLFISFFLTLFTRKMIHTEKEKLKKQIKQKIQEQQD